jgi:DNA invertase Pin-like site-specific DNA recombinase
MRAAIYARVSTQDQNTLALQIKALKKYAKQRQWTIAIEVQDIRSGAVEWKKRDQIVKVARSREIDAVIVWKLDRWGRSLPDLVSTLNEFAELGVAFVSVTEAFDTSTTIGKAMAGMLSVFAEFERNILKERIKAGIEQARQDGRPHGRPQTAARHATKIKLLYAEGMNKASIARKLKIGRTSVIRILANSNLTKRKK